MNEPQRIYAWDLVYKLRSGPAAPLVVCADPTPERYAMRIEGALSLKELESRLVAIPTDKEIVFYSSSPQDTVAIEQARQYQEKGFTRAVFLSGGVDAWNAVSVFRV